MLLGVHGVVLLRLLLTGEGWIDSRGVYWVMVVVMMGVIAVVIVVVIVVVVVVVMVMVEMGCCCLVNRLSCFDCHVFACWLFCGSR